MVGVDYVTNTVVCDKLSLSKLYRGLLQKCFLMYILIITHVSKQGCHGGIVNLQQFSNNVMGGGDHTDDEH